MTTGSVNEVRKQLATQRIAKEHLQEEGWSRCDHDLNHFDVEKIDVLICEPSVGPLTITGQT